MAEFDLSRWRSTITAPLRGLVQGLGADALTGEQAAALVDWFAGVERLTDRRELIGIVNLESLRRRRVEQGEMCEIAGVGPVPVAVARPLFGEALLRIVIRDGVDVRTVVHAGRTASAIQETAVLVRQGGRCARPRCDQPIAEIDHTTGWTETRATTLDDLAGLCGHDHDLKTRHGHTYRRDPGGAITWTRPDCATEHDEPP